MPLSDGELLTSTFDLTRESIVLFATRNLSRSDWLYHRDTQNRQTPLQGNPRHAKSWSVGFWRPRKIARAPDLETLEEARTIRDPKQNSVISSEGYINAIRETGDDSSIDVLDRQGRVALPRIHISLKWLRELKQ
jgi:hypothetical protein